MAGKVADRPVRIAYLTSQYPATSHTFIRREVLALRRQGLAIDTFSVRRPGAGEIRADFDRGAHDETFYLLPAKAIALVVAHLAALLGAPVRYCSTFALALRHRAPGARALVWAVFHFAEAIVLAAELKRRKIAHLHNHFANAAANVGLLASHFLRLPWSLTLHGISETDYPAGLLLADKIAAARFVACVSWFGRAQAMRITPPAQWEKLCIVRCGVNLEELRFTPPKAKGSRIVCVGRLSSEKGHIGLLQAFGEMLRRGTDAHLTLVGDGPEQKMLVALTEQLGLADHVSFSGRLDEREVRDAVAASDLLVLPSFMEGLPVVLMEAMALGVPVVASHVAGIPELVDDRKSGLLFRPSDWMALADAMALGLSDAQLRPALAKRARATIEAEFEISAAVTPLIGRFSTDRESGS